MKITKKELTKIIKEEAENFIKLRNLQERKLKIEFEIKLLEEGSMDDFMSSKNTSNPYDLSNPSVKEEFFNDLISVWTKYCGQNPNSSAVANDNRVMLFNMLNDGTIESKINQIWSPSNLNLGSHGREYPTTKPEMMANHLKNVGITNFELKELK
jgi:hypothetical protein